MRNPKLVRAFFLLDGWYEYSKDNVFFQSYETPYDFFSQGISWTCRVIVFFNEENIIEDVRWHLECNNSEQATRWIKSFDEFILNSTQLKFK